MIHIVNGDCAAERLRPLAKEHWNENVWVYSELLTEGPVYSKFERYLAYRALQLERMCALPAAIYLQKSNEQEKAWKSEIQSATRIALWFEHDLFDITMLLRLADRLVRENPDAKLYWIDIASDPKHDRYRGFGALQGEQLLPYRDQAILLTPEAKEWLQGAWLAYTCPNPLKLVRWCMILRMCPLHIARSWRDSAFICPATQTHAMDSEPPSGSPWKQYLKDIPPLWIAFAMSKSVCLHTDLEICNIGVT
ncbi:DUF1835 domain-containing protein [Paenibacillus apiarius]|uniref:DUF1835 domain-containing protein n=1 Tax=Paenibacillus apiarius TaxID=46240 RepID=A0ABT4DP70_9BACL|nr:DUF1835 domain-containing protein [Paenibacillus apiarius]MCY9513522.1 DUF1835 domain-containing protein [Paenibacillus apiarius]MCY9518073.1 DUF1835 domain-containing protein [Paenibacillus apiarius]MCY9551526.1 DUF1835 domain-containing protein [Paenibacillus apiarius]MCY9558680.1 DUF1835 domain-containing protein [Paenibacillus apiarius]MCY9684006.1 DUF1835 domain-containing protein [Paenibacillus apiarius]